MNYENKLEGLRNSMNEKMKRYNDILNETGSSNWLSVIPMREFNYVLNKQQFWDTIRLRYSWPIPGLPVSCWVSGQRAFFDLRVFDPNAQRYLKQALKQCYSMNENEKKRRYNTRIMEVDQGGFTPLVFYSSWRNRRRR